MDNYEEFKDRLLSASEDLKKRKGNVARQALLVQSLLEQNLDALEKWKLQHSKVHSIQDAYDGGADGYAIISDLVDTADRMVNMFSKRVKVLSQKVASVTTNYEVIEESLHELTVSISKLELSKMFHDDKTKLMEVESSLSGPTYSDFDQSGVSLNKELSHAREAVIMAEALLEVKGH